MFKAFMDYVISKPTSVGLVAFWVICVLTVILTGVVCAR